MSAYNTALRFVNEDRAKKSVVGRKSGRAGTRSTWSVAAIVTVLAAVGVVLGWLQHGSITRSPWPSACSYPGSTVIDMVSAIAAGMDRLQWCFCVGRCVAIAAYPAAFAGVAIAVRNGSALVLHIIRGDRHARGSFVQHIPSRKMYADGLWTLSAIRAQDVAKGRHAAGRRRFRW